MFYTLLMAGQQGESASSGNPLLSFLPIILIFAVFYFFLILPQQRKQKKTQQMINSLKNGDRVLTAGGIIGQVVGTREEIVVVKISDQTKIEINKSYVVSVLDKSGKILEG